MKVPKLTNINVTYFSISLNTLNHLHPNDPKPNIYIYAQNEW